MLKVTFFQEERHLKTFNRRTQETDESPGWAGACTMDGRARRYILFQCVTQTLSKGCGGQDLSLVGTKLGKLATRSLPIILENGQHGLIHTLQIL